MCVLSPFSIYSNGGHFDRLAGSSDITLKVDTPRMIQANRINVGCLKVYDR